jgi:hypothetical protein
MNGAMKTPRPRLVPLLTALTLLACGAGDDAGSFSLRFTWDAPPDGTVHVWARVEHRPEPGVAGAILSSAGPVAFTPGAPVTLALPGVANGDDRVVVIEVREAADASLPVLWYGLSEPFSIQPGEHPEVEVPLSLRLPDTAAVVAATPVSLELDGDLAEAVARVDARRITVVTRSAGAVAITLANDASFSAGLRAFDLASGEGITCDDEVDAADSARTWQVCRVEGWDLLAGLPDLGDGLYSVFVTFTDRNGYPSPVYRDTLRLDDTPPVPLRATLSPRVARAGAVIQLAVSFHEPIDDAPEAGSRLLAQPDEGLTWLGPDPVPGTNTWLWTAAPSAALHGQIFSFEVQSVDALGNRSEPTPLLDEGGAPLELVIDARAPALVDPQGVVYEADDQPVEGAARFGLPGSGAARLSFGFRLADEHPPVLPGLGEPCDAACPRVRLKGRALGQVSRDPAADEAAQGALGFRFDYALDPEDWGAVEEDLEVAVDWVDEAGNALEQILPAPVRFDFVRPYVTDCVLAPEGANAGDALIYRASSSERLSAPPALEVTAPAGAALFTAAPETSAGERTFTWRQPVSGLDATAIGVQVRLTDEAGNPSAGAVCAREVTVDGLAPEVELLTVAVDPPVTAPGGEALLRLGAGDAMRVALRIRELQGLAEGSPSLSLGTPEPSPLTVTALGDEPDGWARYEATLTLGASGRTPSSGAWPLVVRVQDAMGNTWSQPEAEATSVVVDLDDPTATCGLNLPAARAGDLLRVSAVFSELVDPASLALTPSLPGLPFEPEAAQTDLEAYPPRVSYALVVPGGLGELTWGYTLGARDLVGNPADAAPLCEGADLILDTAAPTLDLVEPATMNRALFGPEPADAPEENRLFVGFGLRERFPMTLTGLEGPCTPMDGCPSLTIDGQLMGQVHRVPWRDRPDEHVWGFGYELDVRAADWPPESFAAALAVRWEDRAGNPADVTLPDPVRLDFEPPRALACELSPDPVRAGEPIRLRLTSSEPLDLAPALDVSSDNAGLFASGDPVASSDGRVWTFETPSAGLVEETAHVALALVDPAGNASVQPACELDLPIDVTAPRIDGVAFTTAPEVRDSAGLVLPVAGPGAHLELTLEIHERGALDEAASRIVLAAPEPLALPWTQVKPTGEGAWTLRAALTLARPDHEAYEGAWPLHATLVDGVGNTTRVEGLLADGLVRLDFTPPAAECALIPDPALGPWGLGQAPVLQVTAIEALATGARPEVLATFTPPFEEGEAPLVFQPAPDTAWRYMAWTEPGQGERAIALRVHMRDQAGNETAPGETACLGGALVAALDARPPIPGAPLVEIDEGGVYAPLSGPVRAGRRLRFSIPVQGAGAAWPEAWLGAAPLTPLDRVEGDEAPTWRFERLVDGSEGSGLRALRLRAWDDAGNVFDDALPAAGVLLDLTPPAAECFLAGDGAAAGERVRLIVSFSERIAGDAPELVAGVPFELDEARCGPEDPDCVFEYRHDVAVGVPWTLFSYSVYATDAAGNPAPPVELCAGSGSVDGQAPVVVDGEAVAFERALFGREAPPGAEDNVFSFTYRLSDDGPLALSDVAGPCEIEDGCPEVRLGEKALGQVWRAPSLDSPDEGVLGFQYRYDVSPGDWGDVDRAPAVTVAWQDAAGNRLEQVVGPGLRFDFIPPDVSYAALAITPSAGGHVLAPAAATEGSALWLALTADEALAGPPEVVAARGTRSLAFGPPQVADDPAYEYTLTVSGIGQGEETQGDYALTARLVDAAGNVAERALLTSTPLRVDTIAPTGLGAALDQAVRLRRAPWGSPSGDHGPSVAVLGCPSAAAAGEAGPWPWCPAPWASSLEAGDTVLVYGASGLDGQARCTDELLSWGTMDTAGGAFELPLLADRPVVCVARADQAGNESASDPVRVVAWTGTLAGKTPGDDVSHPARMRRRTSAARAPLRDLLDSEVVMDAATWEGAARPDDGLLASARHSPAWRPAQADGRLPYTLSGHALAMGPGGALMTYGGIEDEQSIAPHQLAWRGDRWEVIGVTEAPFAFHQHAMAYDPGRGRVVAFGGWGTEGQLRAETWEWDSVRWLRHQPEVSPGPRIHAAMAYDPVSRRILLFGGATPGAVEDGAQTYDSSGETWAWDGVSWTALAPAEAPIARHGHAMVTDWRRDRVVLFGGYTSQLGLLINSTWTWDGEGWRLVEVDEAPFARRHHGMAYDVVRDRVVVFGGERVGMLGSGVSMGQDTWEFDGARWISRLWFDGPSPRAGSRLGYDPVTARVVLIGGHDYLQHYDDTWTWDGDAWTEIGAGDARFERYEHRVAYDAAAQTALLFSGHDGTTLDDQPNCLHDLWRWEGGDWRASTAGDLPPARLGHSLTWVGDLGAGVLLGGRGPADWRDDAWALSGGAWTALAPPEAAARRRDQAAGWDRAGGALLVFGGQDEAGALADTWRYDGQAWEAPSLDPSPPARRDAAMAWDGARLVLFGGRAAGSGEQAGAPLADTWAWEGGAWHPLSPAMSPPARAGHEMIWDPDRGRVVLFGGEGANGGTLVDLWEWDGEAWSSLAVTPPFIARPQQGLVYDAAAREALLVADWSGLTWAYGPAHDRPQLLVGFDLAAAHTLEDGPANPGRKQLLELTVSARARGLGHALDTGAAVSGYDVSARTISEPPWLRLNGELAVPDDAMTTWSATFDAAWRAADAAADHLAVERLASEHDGLWLLLEPRAGQGAHPEPAELELDHLEVQLVYRRAPHCDPIAACCDGDGYWSPAGTPCDDGLHATLHDRCRAGLCVGAAPAP